MGWAAQQLHSRWAWPHVSHHCVDGLGHPDISVDSLGCSGIPTVHVGWSAQKSQCRRNGRHGSRDSVGWRCRRPEVACWAGVVPHHVILFVKAQFSVSHMCRLEIVVVDRSTVVQTKHFFLSLKYLMLILPTVPLPCVRDRIE